MFRSSRLVLLVITFAIFFVPCNGQCKLNGTRIDLDLFGDVIDSVRPESRIMILGEEHFRSINDSILMRLLEGVLRDPRVDTIDWIIESGNAEAYMYEQFINSKIDLNDVRRNIVFPIFSDGLLLQIRASIKIKSKYVRVVGVDYEKNFETMKFVLNYILQDYVDSFHLNDPLVQLLTWQRGNTDVDTLIAFIHRDSSRYSVSLGSPYWMVCKILQSYKTNFMGYAFQKHINKGLITPTVLMREEFIANNILALVRGNNDHVVIGKLGVLHVTKQLNCLFGKIPDWSSAMAKVLAADTIISKEIVAIVILYPSEFKKRRERRNDLGIFPGSQKNEISKGLFLGSNIFIFPEQCKSNFDIAIAG